MRQHLPQARAGAAVAGGQHRVQLACAEARRGAASAKEIRTGAAPAARSTAVPAAS
ncbi:MAG TPA: hypothetical protein VEX11_14005 [Acetobacteraceae bacterium]|nr:hypothetical protein [Acetobacteraceae bacterium]